MFLALEQVDFFNNSRWALWIVTLAASILGIRFMGSENVIRTIILPYEAMGVAISAGVPFVIYLFVVEKGLTGQDKKALRTIAWVLFAVVFLALWFYRYETLKGSSALWIYPFTFFASLGMLAFDGTIQKWMAKNQATKGMALSNRKLVAELQRELEDYGKDFKSQGAAYKSVYDPAKKGLVGYKHDIAQVKAQIVALSS